MNNKCFLLLFFLIFSHANFGQKSYFSSMVEEKLANYVKKDYPEKIYVHTDKPYYSIGDDIWFSIYFLNGATHLKSKKSLVLYTELINHKDSILDRKKFFMIDFTANGDFKLNKNIKPGKYLLRAYTNYMLNDDHSYIFKKEIEVLDSNPKIDEIKKSDDSFTIKPEINFYPEGGYLVDNVKNNVAIKFKNDFFSEQKIPVEIKDESGNLVTSFSSTKFGLGVFNLTPEKDKTYFALINFNDEEYKYKLPKSLPEGYVLNVVNNGKKLFLNIKTNKKNGLLGTHLVIHQRGNLIFNHEQKHAKLNETLMLPIKSLQNGVLHITLFNSDGKPSCERLVYVNNPKINATINIKKPKDYYGKRAKVNLNINTKDFNGAYIPSRLSMSVRDMNAFPIQENSENIKTWFLLNSDLRGKVKNPRYFFEDPNDIKRNYLLDLTMLTNGWRRFTWQKLLFETKGKNKFQTESGLMISGKTLSMKPPYGPKSVPTRLTFVGKQIAQEPIKRSNKNGVFSYGPYIFYDTIPVLLESRLTNFKSEKNKDRKVLIIKNNETKSPKIFRDTIPSKSNNSVLNDYLKHQKYLKELDSAFKQQQYVLDEVVVKTNLKTEDDLRRDEMNSRTSYGSAVRRFDATQNAPNNANAIDLFYSVPGVNVINDSIYVRNGGYITPLILFDEMQIDISDLQTIQADEISFVDLLIGADAAIFSSGGAVISIYSKLGNGLNRSRNVKRKPGIIDFKAVGFYTAKEFYSPDHINGIEEQTKADTRTTLHWEPKIKTNATKDVIIEFFTSDLKSNYLIEIEGITKDGVPVYGTSKIIVD